jgi:uncharacterized protein
VSSRNARLGQAAAALGAGAVFGAGLAISGMTRPQKVIGFLDLFGAWDPSLAFVMMGAIAVHLIAYRLVRRRSSPLVAQSFSIPTRRDVDLRLVSGAALFGVGWGLGGYCPGPAVTSLASGAAGVGVFIGTMLVGMLATARIEAAFARSRERAGASPATAREKKLART